MRDVRDTMAAIWSGLLDCGELTAESDFFECGGTSIKAVYLAAEAQERFGVPLDAIEVVVQRTLGKISDLVGDRLAAGSGPAPR